jgi:Flp pilus assembly protein TadD
MFTMCANGHEICRITANDSRTWAETGRLLAEVDELDQANRAFRRARKLLANGTAAGPK